MGQGLSSASRDDMSRHDWVAYALRSNGPHSLGEMECRDDAALGGAADDDAGEFGRCPCP